MWISGASTSPSSYHQKLLCDSKHFIHAFWLRNCKAFWRLFSPFVIAFQIPRLMIHTCPPSLKAPTNNLNHDFLLLRSHFIVARQAETAPEDVRADVLAAADDVGVASGTTIALGGHKRVHPIHRLHMHGFHSVVKTITAICSI